MRRCAVGYDGEFMQKRQESANTMLDAKQNNAPETLKGRYSPADCTGIVKRTVEGQPDEKHISPSFVERQNLTMRMQMRRFTRLTNAFSKKFENHMHMVALYTVWYNFIRIHKTLRVTPAMEAGLSETVWDMDDLVRIMDERVSMPRLGQHRNFDPSWLCQDCEKST